ncbi:hypothetical protein DICVIV_12112 [Dictyocaulus viviparus]|uniref:Uncharacterized protein n=1 Tax=Dictyocaulus viviparus TaxID=29172 RepID=A0A0D8XBE8_DICVI|nr:hypothetical protein DICVIV_12112 [Dictyocaulus viviparus]
MSIFITYNWTKSSLKYSNNFTAAEKLRLCVCGRGKLQICGYEKENDYNERTRDVIASHQTTSLEKWIKNLLYKTNKNYYGELFTFTKKR